MRIPDWWEFLLLALAGYRTWVLLAEDKILDEWRYRLLYPINENDEPVEREGLREFISCPWCFGFWIALAWWIAWLITDYALYPATPLALSAAVALTDRARG